MTRALRLALLIAALSAAAARADDGQDQARAALERGEIRPLDEILAAVHASVPGDIVSVDLDREKGRWRYELKVLTADGRRRQVDVDAASLAITKGKDDD